MSFKPKMVNVETNREMSWLGRLLIPGLFNGEHSFTIEALDEKGVRFVQHEKFTDCLSRSWQRASIGIRSGASKK